MTSITGVSLLSPDEHSRQLRRAVVAATIGTSIEWYDFFLYSDRGKLHAALAL